MNKNLKNIFSNEQKTNIIKLVIAVLFILVMVILTRTSNSSTNSNSYEKETNTPKTDEVLSLLKNLKEDNYEININLTINKDLINIVRRMQNKEAEIFYINFRGEENAYFRDNKDYYIINETGIEKTLVYKKLFEYNETFLLASNIVSLLENNNTSYIDLQEEKYKIRRYKISLNSVLEFYNELYGLSEFTSLSKEISIDIRYNNNTLHSIYMDMTNFNNYIEDTEYNVVLYEIDFVDIGKVNLDTFFNYINK